MQRVVNTWFTNTCISPPFSSLLWRLPWLNHLTTLMQCSTTVREREKEKAMYNYCNISTDLHQNTTFGCRSNCSCHWIVLCCVLNSQKTQKHARIHACTHTHTRTHTRTYARTYAHTHTWTGTLKNIDMAEGQRRDGVGNRGTQKYQSRVTGQ